MNVTNVAALIVGLAIVSLLIPIAAGIVIGLRWLGVAQRADYLAPGTSRAAWAAITARPLNVILALVAALLILVSLVINPVALVPIILLAFLPIGARVKLDWTPRLGRLAFSWGVLALVIGYILFRLFGSTGPALVLFFAAPVIDLAIVIMTPIEQRMSRS